MKEEIITIQDYIDILRRRKWSILLPAVLVFAAAVAAAFLIPKTYQSTSTILIEEQEIPREFVTSTVTGFADQRLQLINQRVMASAKLMGIANKFNLYSDKRNAMTDEDIVEKMRKDIVFKTISADINNSRSGNQTAATIAFSLSYEGNNPELVQKVTAALTSLYLEENLKEREQQSAGAYNFLEDEANNLKKQINQKDSAIADFKNKNIDALPEMLSGNLQSIDRIGQDVDRLNDSLRGLIERKTYYQSQMATIPNEADSQDKILLRELKAKLVQLESRYSNQYPEVIKTKSEIAKLETRIGNSEKTGTTGIRKSDNPSYVTLASQLAGVQSEIDSVRRQIDDLNRKKADYRRRIDNSPKVDETYKQMILERNNLQTKYDDLMRKALDAKISHGLEREQMGERFNLIEPAKMPKKPVKPNVPAIMLIGLVLGIGAGIGTASIREAMDQSIRSAKFLSAETSLPVLVSIPDIVTWGDIEKQRKRRIIMLIGMAVFVMAGIAAFHFYVMDLDIVWAKLLRRLNA